MHKRVKLGGLVKGASSVLLSCSCSVSQTLCDPMDCSPPGSSVHGFSRQEYWSGLPFPSPGDLPNLEIRTWVSCALAGRLFTTAPPRKPQVQCTILCRCIGLAKSFVHFFHKMALVELSCLAAFETILLD